MKDKEFRALYKKDFDSICASNELKNAVKNLKPQKPRRVVTPFKAALGTVAAAVMIFAAVHDYSFEKDTSGVISETVVSTELPETQFEAVEKEVIHSEAMPSETQRPAKSSVRVAVQEPTSSIAEKATSLPYQEERAVFVIPKPEQKAAEVPVPTEEIAQDIKPIEDTGAVMSLAEDEPSSRSGGSTYVPPSVETWSVEDYYNYLGTDVSQKISGEYIGAQSFEFEVGSDGVPLDDTVVLNFATNSGANVSATVSKHVLFDESLSGTVSDTGNGYNAYKVSDDVYYNIYATNTTRDEVIALINNL